MDVTIAIFTQTSFLVTEQPTIYKCQVFVSIGSCASSPWLSRAPHTTCATSTPSSNTPARPNKREELQNPFNASVISQFPWKLGLRCCLQSEFGCQEPDQQTH